MNLLYSLCKEEEGQGMTEYGLIIALVAVALIVTLVAFKDKLVTLFNGLSLAAPTT